MKKEKKIEILRKKEFIYKDALKLYSVTACLDSAGRVFQYFTPLNKKLF